jgi:serine/threonine-protein kinase
MGAVYRAYDRLTGETVALKRLPASPVQLASPELRLALTQEFQALAALRHANVIGVREYGFDEDHQPYFTMELLPEARPITGAGQYLPYEPKTRLLWKLLSGLVYVHRHRLIHRDLKPANVLVAGDSFHQQEVTARLFSELPQEGPTIHKKSGTLTRKYMGNWDIR